MTNEERDREHGTQAPPAAPAAGEPVGRAGEEDEAESTVGTGSALALGCVGVMLVLILLGVLFFLILWLIA